MARNGRLRALAASLAPCTGPSAGRAGSRAPAEAGTESGRPQGRAEARAQLEELGFCVVPNILSSELLGRLRAVTDAALDAQTEEEQLRHRSQGSMIAVPGRDQTAVVDPVFLELLTWRPALDSLVSMGFPRGSATFTDGYVISKPPRSPPLFWHYDWFSWELQEDWEPAPLQVFLMYYLHSTERHNGCLRVIPRSHYQHNPLRDALDSPHNSEYARAKDLSIPAFAERNDEVDVPITAGDLLIGDARMLHATNPNDSSGRRTVITLWFQPDYDNLPLKTQAQMLLKTMDIPSCWQDEALRPALDAMMPPAHWDRLGHGDVDQLVEQRGLDVSRQLYRRKEAAAA